MKLTTTKSKSIVSGVLIAGALSFTASAAMAATPHKAVATTHVVHTSHAVRHVAAAKRRPEAWQQPALAQFFGGLFGLPFPLSNYAAGNITAHAARGAVSSDAGGYDPTFDTPSPTVDVDNSQSQQAIEESDEAIQQADQDSQNMDASVAASEAQNDAANAATEQYMINNGM